MKNITNNYKENLHSQYIKNKLDCNNKITFNIDINQQQYTNDLDKINKKVINENNISNEFEINKESKTDYSFKNINNSSLNKKKSYKDLYLMKLNYLNSNKNLNNLSNISNKQDLINNYNLNLINTTKIDSTKIEASINDANVILIENSKNNENNISNNSKNLFNKDTRFKNIIKKHNNIDRGIHSKSLYKQNLFKPRHSKHYNYEKYIDKDNLKHSSKSINRKVNINKAITSIFLENELESNNNKNKLVIRSRSAANREENDFINNNNNNNTKKFDSKISFARVNDSNNIISIDNNDSIYNKKNKYSSKRIFDQSITNKNLINKSKTFKDVSYDNKQHCFKNSTYTKNLKSSSKNLQDSILRPTHDLTLNCAIDNNYNNINNEKNLINNMQVRNKLKKPFLYLAKYHIDLKEYLISFQKILRFFCKNSNNINVITNKNNNTSNNINMYKIKSYELEVFLKKLSPNSNYINEINFTKLIYFIIEKCFIPQENTKNTKSNIYEPIITYDINAPINLHANYVSTLYNMYFHELIFIAEKENQENLFILKLIDDYVKNNFYINNEYLSSNCIDEYNKCNKTSSNIFIDKEVDAIISYIEVSLAKIYETYFYKNNFEHLKNINLKNFNIKMNKNIIIDLEKKIDNIRDNIIKFTYDFGITNNIVKIDNILHIFDQIINELLVVFKKKFNSIINFKLDTSNEIKNFNYNLNELQNITSKFGKSDIKYDQNKFISTDTNKEIITNDKKVLASYNFNKDTLNLLNSDNSFLNIFSYKVFKLFLVILSEYICTKNIKKSSEETNIKSFSIDNNLDYDNNQLSIADKLILLLNHIEKSNGISKMLYDKRNSMNLISVKNKFLLNNFNKESVESCTLKKNNTFINCNNKEKINKNLFNANNNIYKNNVGGYWNFDKLEEINKDEIIKMITYELKNIRSVFLYFSNLREKNLLQNNLSYSNFLEFVSYTNFFNNFNNKEFSLLNNNNNFDMKASKNYIDKKLNNESMNPDINQDFATKNSYDLNNTDKDYTNVDINCNNDNKKNNKYKYNSNKKELISILYTLLIKYKKLDLYNIQKLDKYNTNFSKIDSLKFKYKSVLFDINLFIEALFLLSIKIYYAEEVSSTECFKKFINKDLKIINKFINKIIQSFNNNFDFILSKPINTDNINAISNTNANIILNPGNNYFVDIIKSVYNFIYDYYLLFCYKDVDILVNNTISFEGVMNFLSSFNLYPDNVSFLQLKYAYIYVLDKISKIFK